KYGARYGIQREVDALFFTPRSILILVPLVVESHIPESATQMMTQQQLSHCLSQLRVIRSSQSTDIGFYIGGPTYDYRLNDGVTCGPSTSETSFNNILIAPFVWCPCPKLAIYYRQPLIDSHGITFTNVDMWGSYSR
ncbi:hypothetical protein GQ43DRAFT_491262, partial [Delitschia confertaspora ATCC 74209]